MLVPTEATYVQVWVYDNQHSYSGRIPISPDKPAVTTFNIPASTYTVSAIAYKPDPTSSTFGIALTGGTTTVTLQPGTTTTATLTLEKFTYTLTGPTTVTSGENATFDFNIDTHGLPLQGYGPVIDVGTTSWSEDGQPNLDKQSSRLMNVGSQQYSFQAPVVDHDTDYFYQIKWELALRGVTYTTGDTILYIYIPSLTYGEQLGKFTVSTQGGLDIIVQ